MKVSLNRTKDAARAELQKQVDEFLSKGGKIQVIPFGVTASQETSAPRLYTDKQQLLYVTD